MDALALRLRADLRGRLGPALALVALVGLLGGVVLAAAAGARRTATAHDRMMAATKAWDVLVNPDLGTQSALDPEAVKGLPMVADAGVGYGMPVGPAGPDGGLDFTQPMITVAAADAVGVEVLAGKLLAGRLPQPHRADEILITPGLAEDWGVSPGDPVELVTMAPGLDVEAVEALEQAGEPLPFVPETFTVAGVGVSFDQVVVDEAYTNELLLLTPAFHDAHRGQAFFFGVFARLRGGSDDVAAFRAAVEALVPEEAIEFQTREAVAATVDRAVRPLALATAAFATGLGLVGLLVAGQALSRHVAPRESDAAALRALGLRRGQVAAAGVAQAALVAAAGAVLAVGVAVALSPVFPLGPARVAEPAPGVEVNVAVLGAGAGLLVALLAAWAAPSAWAAARGTPAPSRRRASRVVTSLARAGARPPAVAGVRMALEPGRGATATPVRSVLVGLAVTVAAVAATVVVGASLDRLVTTPPLYGWNWDALLSAPVEEIPVSMEAGAAHADVAGAAVLRPDRLELAGRPVPAVGFRILQGDTAPTVVRGRLPASDDEIALGGRTLERLGVDVGDRVAATSRGGARELLVVGQAVLPGIGTYPGADRTELGTGAVVTDGALDDLGAGFEFGYLALDVAPGTDPVAVAEAVGATVGADEDSYLTPQRPGDVAGLASVRATPALLTAVLAVVAVAALAHGLTATIRRRRRDLAVLKTLGFARRQVHQVVAWQATVTAAVAVGVGLPVGVAVGRWGWQWAAAQLGVPAQPVVPLLAVILVVPGLVALANLLAALPGRAAGRLRPASVLRAE